MIYNRWLLDVDSSDFKQILSILVVFKKKALQKPDNSMELLLIDLNAKISIYFNFGIYWKMYVPSRDSTMSPVRFMTQ